MSEIVSHGVCVGGQCAAKLLAYFIRLKMSDLDDGC